MTRIRTLPSQSETISDMTNNVKILFTLRESRGGSSYHVQVRVTVNGQRENIKSLGIEVQKKDWDYARQRIKGNGPDARANNLKIATVEADINNLVLDSEVKKKPSPLHYSNPSTWDAQNLKSVLSNWLPFMLILWLPRNSRSERLSLTIGDYSFSKAF